MANDLLAKSYTCVTKRLFNRQQTKIISAPYNVTNYSQATTSSSRTTPTSDSTLTSSTSSNSTSHQNKKEQHKTKAQNRRLSQKQGKAQMDSVQVHNWYGHTEDEPVWNLPPDDSPSPMDESPLDTRRSPKGSRLNGPNGSKVIPDPPR